MWYRPNPYRPLTRYSYSVADIARATGWPEARVRRVAKRLARDLGLRHTPRARIPVALTDAILRMASGLPPRA